MWFSHVTELSTPMTPVRSLMTSVLPESGVADAVKTPKRSCHVCISTPNAAFSAAALPRTDTVVRLGVVRTTSRPCARSHVTRCQYSPRADAELIAEVFRRQRVVDARRAACGRSAVARRCACARPRRDRTSCPPAPARDRSRSSRARSRASRQRVHSVRRATDQQRKEGRDEKLLFHARATPEADPSKVRCVNTMWDFSYQRARGVSLWETPYN